MRRALCLPLALLMLTACSPLQTFYKPGASFALVDAETTACQVDALRQVPVANTIVQDPPRYIPAEKICDSDGNCRIFPPEILPGRIRTVDANLELRQRVTRQCMATKGFSLEKIRACPLGTKATAPTKTLPPLTAASCALRNPDGSVAILQQSSD